MYSAQPESLHDSQKDEIKDEFNTSYYEKEHKIGNYLCGGEEVEK